MDWLQLISEYFSNFFNDPFISQIVSGAVEGVVIGIIAGGIIWAIVQAPDTLGRGLLLAIVFGIVIVIWEFAKIGSVMGLSMGRIIGSLNDNPAIGSMFLQAGLRTLLAMTAGIIIGVGSQVPQHVIRGALWGIFAGALVGALLTGGLNYYGVRLNVIIYRGLVALGVWGLLITFSGK